MAPTASSNNNNSSSGNNKTTTITAISTTSAAASVAAAAATARGGAGAAAGGAGGAPPLPPRRIMSNVQNALALLVALVLLCGLTGGVDGLKCHMCGQYNEGVGSITPCLNYSEQHAHLNLKECSKKTEKFCVKYVSELSTVRDCATECAEKEVWETQTYCCDHDGCNGSSNLRASTAAVLILPLLYYVLQAGRCMTLQVRR